MMLLSYTAFGQNGLTGQVIDNNNMPLPGVSVVIKGTTAGTITDFDGNYNLNTELSDSTVLVFSYVGFKTQEIVVDGQSVINVLMEEDKSMLDEVVVIGYGTQKKSVVTGAISGVKQTELEDLPITRVEQTLQGRVSGVTIAATSG